MATAESGIRRTRIQRVAIVGGGLVGALNACFFAKRGWQVDLYEFREDIRTLEHVPGRSINLALSYRGRCSLAAVGLEKYVVENGIPMHARLIHDKNGRIVNRLPYGRRGQYILSTSRRWLNEVMLSEAEKYPMVKIHFQHKLEYCNLAKKELIFEKLSDGSKVVASGFDLICGCDGAYSALRRSLMKVPGFNYSQEYIPHGYLEFCILSSPNNQFKMEANVFHLWPRGDFCLIALANKDKTFTTTFFAPWAVFDKLSNDKKILEFFSANFPDALDMIGEKDLLDTFHRVKPGHLVSIKGFEDCLTLHELLDQHNDNVAETLKTYSALRCPDAHAINDLAMYNYLELRGVIKSLKTRKYLDNFFNMLMPKRWVPLYTMVTFSRMRYHKVVENRRKQDQILSVLTRAAIVVITIPVLAGAVAYLARVNGLKMRLEW